MFVDHHWILAKTNSTDLFLFLSLKSGFSLILAQEKEEMGKFLSIKNILVRHAQNTWLSKMMERQIINTLYAFSHCWTDIFSMWACMNSLSQLTSIWSVIFFWVLWNLLGNKRTQKNSLVTIFELIEIHRLKRIFGLNWYIHIHIYII